MHFFQILFSYKSLQNIEYGFLSYTVGPWFLLYISHSVCVNPNPLIHPYPLTFHFGIQKLVFCVYESISVLYILLFISASIVAQMVEPLPAMWETWVQSLSWEDPLEKGKATHSSILAWRIPWTVASQAPLSIGFPRQECLECVGISSSRGSSPLTNQTHISCISYIGRQILYP